MDCRVKPGNDEVCRMTIAGGRLDRLPRASAAARFAGFASLPNVMLVACVVIVVWFVFVPLSALVYNAFTEDTGFGPGAFSLENFVEAYSSWHILRLFWNSLVFALGTAATTFVMGALVAWAVERTDAPGAVLFHALSLVAFAVSRPAHGHGLDLRLQPEHRLGQRGAEIAFRPA
jgi:ABC-type sugar transport system permease subunit